MSGARVQSLRPGSPDGQWRVTTTTTVFDLRAATARRAEVRLADEDWSPALYSLSFTAEDDEESYVGRRIEVGLYLRLVLFDPAVAEQEMPRIWLGKVTSIEATTP